MRPPIAWQEASLAGAARLAGRLAERPASENACENVSEAAREAACAIACENACATALRGRVRQCVRSGMRYRTRKASGLARENARDLASRPAREIARGSCARSQCAPRGIPARLTYPLRLTLCVTPSYRFNTKKGDGLILISDWWPIVKVNPKKLPCT